MSIDVAAPASTESRVSKILSMLQNNIDTKEIAASMRFTNVRDMGEYMRNKGYKWDAGKSTYLYVGQLHFSGSDDNNKVVEEESPSPSSSRESIEKQTNILRLLEQYSDKLVAMFGESVEDIPRYILPGISRTKSFHLNHGLELLTKEFSQEKNVSQKEIIQTALVEFFKRYGYQNEIKRLTGR